MTDELLIHGANAVGPLAPAGWTVACLLVLGAIGAAAFARTNGVRRARAVLAVAGLAALPGLVVLGAGRPDRPASAGSAAVELRQLHDAIRGFAGRRGCGRIVLDGCPACRPVAILATAGLRCDADTVVELEAGAIGGRCTEPDARTLRCAGGP